MESSGTTPAEEVLANARPFELAMAYINRAKRYVSRILQNEMHYEIGDMVLLRRGRQPKGSKFEAKMWVCPFEVMSVKHPRYVLKNALGRNSTKHVLFKR